MIGDSDLPPLLTGAQILARLRQVSLAVGLDADTLRGRAWQTDAFRLNLAPPFTPPPTYGDTVAQSLFGV